MSRCVNHPGRHSTTVIFGKAYCSECNQGIMAARSRVDRHVEPKECFVWYVGNNNWQPITGTGCAHWVSHQLNIHQGSAGDQCLAGFTYRVPVMVRGRQRITDINQVRLNDIYVTPAMDHTGLVVRVTPAQNRPGTPSQPATPTIIIRHDSSGQGRVAENEFGTYFHGRGSFYR